MQLCSGARTATCTAVPSGKRRLRCPGQSVRMRGPCRRCAGSMGRDWSRADGPGPGRRQQVLAWVPLTVSGDGSGAIKEKDQRNYLPGPSLCFRFSSAMPTLGSTACTGAQPGRAGLHGIPLGPTETASYPRAPRRPCILYLAGENGDAVYVTRAWAHPPATTVPGVSKIPGSSFCPYFRA